MAYSGYLLKFGGSSGEVFPEKYMYKDSYDARIEIQDLDSGRDANGELKRNVLDHPSAVVTFTIKPCMESTFNEAMGIIRRHYTGSRNSFGVYTRRDVILYFFCPEYGDYFSGTFYLSTPQPKIMQTYHNPNNLRYDATNLEFIMY